MRERRVCPLTAAVIAVNIRDCCNGDTVRATKCLLRKNCFTRQARGRKGKKQRASTTEITSARRGRNVLGRHRERKRWYSRAITLLL